MVVPPLRAITPVADRIEHAYLRHCPLRQPQAVRNSGVWIAAAAALLRWHWERPELPLDPEWFVAAQARVVALSNPWCTLVDISALHRYRDRVERIVAQLRAELTDELRRIEDRIQRGHPLEQVLNWPTRKLSPLGRFLAAHRAGRPDLAEPFRAACRAQHRACPLYRRACADLLPDAAYPVLDMLPELGDRPSQTSCPYQFGLN